MNYGPMNSNSAIFSMAWAEEPSTNALSRTCFQVLIAGRSRHVGLPLALLLQGYQTNPDLPEIGEATILLAHRHTSGHNLRDMASRADIIISATGVVGLIQPDMIKEGAVLMDVGITRKITPGGKIRLMGDIDPKCKGFDFKATSVQDKIYVGCSSRTNSIFYSLKFYFYKNRN